MRLWTLHPKYFDPQGLVAVWREALLARAVLAGETRGYKHHPQLARFRSHEDPLTAINFYLAAIFDASAVRGYSFDARKINGRKEAAQIAVTSGQVAFEWQHLRAKLKGRSPLVFEIWRETLTPECHPLFRTIPGETERWERSS